MKGTVIIGKGKAKAMCYEDIEEARAGSGNTATYLGFVPPPANSRGTQGLGKGDLFPALIAQDFAMAMIVLIIVYKEDVRNELHIKSSFISCFQTKLSNYQVRFRVYSSPEPQFPFIVVQIEIIRCGVLGTTGPPLAPATLGFVPKTS